MVFSISPKSQFSYKNHLLKLSAFAVVLGITNLGWSAEHDQEYVDDLRREAVVQWTLQKAQGDMKRYYDATFDGVVMDKVKADNSAGLYLSIKQVDDLTGLVAAYHGPLDLSLKPSSHFEGNCETLESLGHVLGIPNKSLSTFAKHFGYKKDTLTFPANVVESYRWMPGRSSLLESVDLHHDESTIFAPVGGPVSAVAAFEIAVKSFEYGSEPNIILTLMGQRMPDYTYEFLKSFNAHSHTIPSDKGVWSSVYKTRYPLIDKELSAILTKAQLYFKRR